MATRKLFILGGPDPEMRMIEKVIEEYNQDVAYATVGGRRVHPGNAYNATWYEIINKTREKKPEYNKKEVDIYAVECSGPGIPETAKVIDHHRPGDPGYGKPPKKFLEGSSLGQVLLALTEYKEKFVFNVFFGTWWLGNQVIPRNLLLVAAADHCLHAAYRGKCPGVDPEDLMVFRATTRAKFHQRLAGEVLADIEKAREWLREEVAKGNKVPHASEPIPELLEASAVEGIGFTTFVPDKNDNMELVYQGGTPEEIKSWMEEQKDLGREVHGDPDRGFAGAYL